MPFDSHRSEELKSDDSLAEFEFDGCRDDHNLMNNTLLQVYRSAPTAMPPKGCGTSSPSHSKSDLNGTRACGVEPRPGGGGVELEMGMLFSHTNTMMYRKSLYTCSTQCGNMHYVQVHVA